MTDPSIRVTAPHDPKGRLISIFVGAVLLPSLALCYVSIEFVPQLAKANKAMGVKRAETTLADIARDLVRAADAAALEAAQAVGTERLLDGRESVITAALKDAGLEPDIFETLHLEGASSPRRRWPAGNGGSVSWVDAEGKGTGVLPFRFRPRYVRERLVPDYFAHDFPNPEQALVV